MFDERSYLICRGVTPELPIQHLLANRKSVNECAFSMNSGIGGRQQ